MIIVSNSISNIKNKSVAQYFYGNITYVNDTHYNGVTNMYHEN